jgi:metal-responsive CopG/Arc/MetJ family transcriptional regulator
MTMIKVKVSVSIPADVLDAVDRKAKRVRGETRSSVMADWLRKAAQREAQLEYEEEVVRYYESLTDEERAEQEAESEAWSKAAIQGLAESERAHRSSRRRPKLKSHRSPARKAAGSRR